VGPLITTSANLLDNLPVKEFLKSVEI